MTHRTRADWRQLIEEQQQSGLSQRAFCQARGLNAKYFSGRKTQLLRNDNRQQPMSASRFVKAAVPTQLSPVQPPMARLHYEGLLIEFSGEPSELADLVKQLA